MLQTPPLPRTPCSAHGTPFRPFGVGVGIDGDDGESLDEDLDRVVGISPSAHKALNCHVPVLSLNRALGRLFIPARSGGRPERAIEGAASMAAAARRVNRPLPHHRPPR